MSGDVVNETAQAAPAAPLRPFLGRYTGYRVEGVAPGSHQGVPSPALTVVISLGDPLDVVRSPDPAQGRACYRALAAGLHDTAATLVHDGRQHGIQLALSPLGARTFLGLPAAELSGTIVELEDVLGADAARTVDRLQGSGTWAERFALLDEVLLRRLADTGRRGVRPEVAWAWRRLLDSGGTVDVAALADEVGWSTRHLGHCFGAELGLAPKRAARIVRFHRARRLVESGRWPTLAAVAAECGYADQSHLTREWKAIAGVTPSAWLADELRSVQDPGTGVVHDGPHD